MKSIKISKSLLIGLLVTAISNHNVFAAEPVGYEPEIAQIDARIAALQEQIANLQKERADLEGRHRELTGLEAIVPLRGARGEEQKAEAAMVAERANAQLAEKDLTAILGIAGTMEAAKKRDRLLEKIEQPKDQLLRLYQAKPEDQARISQRADLARDKLLAQDSMLQRGWNTIVRYLATAGEGLAGLVPGIREKKEYVKKRAQEEQEKRIYEAQQTRQEQERTAQQQEEAGKYAEEESEAEEFEYPEGPEPEPMFRGW